MPTVVASASGPLLFVFPVVRRAVDRAALARVLARYDRQLLPGAIEGNEWIAGEGMSPADAARMAEDLRGLGLTVRVVNRDALTTSRRVGNAVSALAIGMMLTLPMGVLLTTTSDTPSSGLPLLAAGLLLVVNFLVLSARGGMRLGVAGASAQPAMAGVDALVLELERLRSELPEHLVAPLVARADALVEEARRRPDGRAARELVALVAELDAARDEAVAADADALRRELARARRAVGEIG
ncbi:MAG: hypothetical protein H6737_14225 [Alphaproteobacteria bacterium]|nr:hypothetical protein [Alphaproteobacteria bacterium]